MRRDPRNSHHLATISYDGRFWDAYLELEDAPAPDAPARGRIAFSAADEGAPEPVRTTTIFLESSPQEVLTRARDFKTHQLVALLRSSIPTDSEAASNDAAEATGELERPPQDAPGSAGSAEEPGATEGPGPSSG